MNEPQTERKKNERSPSFPFIPLKTAIDRLQEFELKFQRQEPPADRVYLAWDMKGDTSQAQQTLAALKAFGLVEYKGGGPKRLVAISDDARTYLRAQQDSIKKEVLKRLALKPKWIAHFWNIWHTDRVPDEMRLDTLVLTHKFNANAAPNFLRVYDETIAYAGLTDSDKVAIEEPEKAQETVKSGDKPPAKDIMADVFRHHMSPAARHNTGQSQQGQGQGKAKLMEGERELTTGLLSKDSSFRLIVSGNVGVKEIERLIAKLTLDKEILADTDGEDKEDIFS